MKTASWEGLWKHFLNESINAFLRDKRNLNRVPGALELREFSDAAIISANQEIARLDAECEKQLAAEAK